MNQIAKIIFLVVGCILPILIGGLHTAVHFKDLVRPEVEQFLQKEIVIMGETQIMWNSWGLVSFMMGTAFIVIGLLNISTLKRLSKTDCLPIMTLVAMILYQSCVIYVGYEFEAAHQFYGGIFGAMSFVFSLILTLKQKQSV